MPNPSLIVLLSLLFAICQPLLSQVQPPAVIPKDRNDIAAPNGPKSDAEVHAIWLQARALVQQSQYAEARGLMEDAVRQRPRNAAYHEELGLTLIGASGTLPEGIERKELVDKAHQEFLRAKGLGDDSPYLKVMLEQLGQAASNAPLQSLKKTPAQEAIATGEILYSKGDFDGALTQYKRALELDPGMYEAALFAGDVMFRKGDADAAGKWYETATEIDPNRETAYRYWGDVLQKSGRRKEAGEKLIAGVIAQPYVQAGWIGLQQWALVNHVSFSPPSITLPPGPDLSKNAGGLTLTLPGSKNNDPNAVAWMSYSLIRAGSQISATKPDKNGALNPYRHSLADEATALRAAIDGSKSIPEAKLDPSLRELKALEKDGMLEAWILLNHADQGIAQDYAAYRTSHTKQLHDYIAKYVAHGA